MTDDTQPDVNFIMTDNGITVFYDGNDVTVDSTNTLLFDAVFNAIKSRDFTQLAKLLNIKKDFANCSAGSIDYIDGSLYRNGDPLHSFFEDRIYSLLERGEDILPLLKFIDNLYMNPSFTAIKEFFLFLEKANLPITSDGHFLAYKMVGMDYLDIHSQTFDNSVGQILHMERNQVNDNREITCSEGFHFCSREYVTKSGFGNAASSRMMVLKINPADVVSIPKDYNDAKGRCCGYEVVDEISWDKTIEKPLNDKYDDFSDDDYEDDDIYIDSESDDVDDFDDWLPESTTARKVAQPVKTLNTSREITDSVILGVIDDINDDELSLTAIAKKWNISRRSVGRIRDDNR
jgi:hypothetical protein